MRRIRCNRCHARENGFRYLALENKQLIPEARSNVNKDKTNRQKTYPWTDYALCELRWDNFSLWSHLPNTGKRQSKIKHIFVNRAMEKVPKVRHGLILLEHTMEMSKNPKKQTNNYKSCSRNFRKDVSLGLETFQTYSQARLQQQAKNPLWVFKRCHLRIQSCMKKTRAKTDNQMCPIYPRRTGRGLE